MSNPDIHAVVVYDGRELYIPNAMLPKADSREAALQLVQAANQMQSTVGDSLCELAGRGCYDSLGSAKSRPTPDYHKHIRDVNHGSVYEHFNFTAAVQIPATRMGSTLRGLVNRPGLWVGEESLAFRPGGFGEDILNLRLTPNIRTVREWNVMSDTLKLTGVVREWADKIGDTLAVAAKRLAPMACADLEPMHRVDFGLDDPKTDDERWISMFLSGSRGFSHEQVRHGDWTAISQRSTRFVDESGSPYVLHPALSAYLNETGDTDVAQATSTAMTCDRAAYDLIVKKLQPWFAKKGCDALTARKQARGAARGFLGNALYTEMIFSASVRQWKWMLKNRACLAADAEIREVMVKALVGDGERPGLNGSKYAKEFANLVLGDSPDGIGNVVKSA